MKPLNRGILGGVHHRQGTLVGQAAGPVERDHVACLECLAAGGQRAGRHVDLQLAGADDAALAPTAGHEGGVAGHAAAGREDTLGRSHAFHVLGVRLFANQDALFAGLGGGNGRVGGEHDHAARSAGTGRKALEEGLGLLLGFGIDDRVEKFVELRGSEAGDGGLLVDQLLGEHVHGHVEGGRAGAFAVAALEHVELAFLDGELDVLHVLVVRLELVADVVQLLVRLGPLGLEGGQVTVLVVLRLFVRAGWACECRPRRLHPGR